MRAAGDLAGQRVVRVDVVAGRRSPAAGYGLCRPASADAGRAAGSSTASSSVAAATAATSSASRARRSRHGQVEAGGERGDPVVDRAPVGDDEALEAPLVAQHAR